MPVDLIYGVEKVMRETSEKNPLDFRHAIILGDFYVAARDRDPEFLAKGEETFKRAIELSPANQQGYMLLAKAYTFKKEYEKAEPLLLRSLELEPRYVGSPPKRHSNSTTASSRSRNAAAPLLPLPARQPL